jgi:DNA-directed RNA polymerase subunit F
MPEDWNANEYVELMLSEEREVAEMLMDLTPEQLAEIEVVLAEREANRAKGYLR